MSAFRYDATIIERFPSIRAGALVARGVTNGPSSAALAAELTAAQQEARERIGDTPLSEVPSLAAWRRAFTAFGVSPATVGLARFRDIHPAVKLFVREMGTVDAQDALGREEVDLALLHPPLDRVDLSLSALGVEPLDALYRPDLYSLCDHPTLADLLAYPLIWYPYSRAPRLTTRFLALSSAAGRAPDIAAEAESSLAAIAMAAAGLGIALLPRSFSKIGAAGCAVRALAGAPLYLERAAALRTRDGADPVLNSLVDCQRDAFGVSACAATEAPAAETAPPKAPPPA